MSETARIEQLRSFLLGRLSEGEHDRIEEALLADEDLFELSLALEDELVDELLRGDLSEAETCVLTDTLSRLPDGSLRVQLARALQARSLSPADRVTPFSAPRRRNAVFSWVSEHAVSTAAVLLLAFGLTLTTVATSRLVSRVHDLENELGRSQQRIGALGQDRGPVPVAEPSVDQAAPPPAADRAGSSTPSQVQVSPSRTTAVLTAGALRGGRDALPIVRISGAHVIDLELDLGADEYPTYRAALCDADGKEIASVSRVQARSTDERILVTFSILSEWLRRGDYFVALDGVTPSGDREPVQRYDFRVQVESPRAAPIPSR